MEDIDNTTPEERRIADAADRMAARGVPDAQIDAFVRRALDRLTKNVNDKSMAQEASYGERFGGNLGNLVRDIPGAEGVLAGLSSAIKRQPYGDALAALRKAEGTAPASVAIPTRITGAGLSMATSAPARVIQAAEWLRRGANAAPTVVRGAMKLAASAVEPTTAATQGARYGVASGLAQADEADLSERVTDAAAEGLGGGVGGKAGEFVGTALRAGMSKTLGEVSQQMKRTRRGLAKKNYGMAEAEGAAATNQDVLTPVLESQTIKPFADKVRATEQFAGADEATIARETFKLMSRTQGKLGKQVEGSPEFLADIDLQKGDITLGKKRLLEAMRVVMPSMPKAVATHAKEMGKRRAFEKMSDATRNVVMARDVSGKRLEKDAIEAVLADIKKIKPAEAKPGVQGVLSRIKDIPEFTANPVSGFGVVSSTARIPLAMLRSQPYLRELDKKAGTGGITRLLEKLGIATSTAAINNPRTRDRL